MTRAGQHHDTRRAGREQPRQAAAPAEMAMWQLPVRLNCSSVCAYSMVASPALQNRAHDAVSLQVLAKAADARERCEIEFSEFRLQRGCVVCARGGVPRRVDGTRIRRARHRKAPSLADAGKRPDDDGTTRQIAAGENFVGTVRAEALSVWPSRCRPLSVWVETHCAVNGRGVQHESRRQRCAAVLRRHVPVADGKTLREKPTLAVARWTGLRSRRSNRRFAIRGHRANHLLDHRGGAAIVSRRTSGRWRTGDDLFAARLTSSGPSSWVSRWRDGRVYATRHRIIRQIDSSVLPHRWAGTPNAALRYSGKKADGSRRTGAARSRRVTTAGNLRCSGCSGDAVWQHPACA